MATAQPFGREMTNREFFIQRWEQEYPAFMRVFDALPGDQLGYRLHPRSRSAAELVWVLAYGEKACADLLDTGTLDWKESPPPGDLGELIAIYNQNHIAMGYQLKKTDEAAWVRQGKCIHEGHLLMQTPVRDILWLVLFDAIHHRGQHSAYIRPMGGKVPSIYGPSADDAGS